MADGDLHDQILRLEADIEELTEVIERCGKVGQRSAAAQETIGSPGLHLTQL
jgi:hypothetical protein